MKDFKSNAGIFFKVSKKQFFKNKNLYYSEEEMNDIISERDIDVMLAKFDYNVSTDEDKGQNEILVNESKRDQALKSYGEIYRMFFKKYMTTAMNKAYQKDENGKYRGQYISDMMKNYNDFMTKFLAGVYHDLTFRKEDLTLPGIDKEFVESILYKDFPKNNIAEAKKYAEENVIGKSGESHKLCDNLTKCFNEYKADFELEPGAGYNEEDHARREQDFLNAYKLLQEKYHQRNSVFYNWVPFRRGWTESRLLNKMRDEYMKINGIKTKEEFNKILDEKTIAYDLAKKDFEKNVDVDVDEIINNLKKEEVTSLQKYNEYIKDQNEWRDSMEYEHVKEIYDFIDAEKPYADKVQGTRFELELMKDKNDYKIYDRYKGIAYYSTQSFKESYETCLKNIKQEKDELKGQEEESPLNYTMIEEYVEQEPTPEELLFNEEVDRDIQKKCAENTFNTKLARILKENNIVEDINPNDYVINIDGIPKKLNEDASAYTFNNNMYNDSQDLYDGIKNDYLKSVQDYNKALNNCYRAFKDNPCHLENETYKELCNKMEQIKKSYISNESLDGAIQCAKDNIKGFSNLVNKYNQERKAMLNRQYVEEEVEFATSQIGLYDEIGKELNQYLDDLETKQQTYKISYFNKPEDIVDNDYMLDSKEEYIKKHLFDIPKQEVEDDELEIDFENKNISDEDLDKNNYSEDELEPKQ